MEVMYFFSGVICGAIATIVVANIMVDEDD